MRFCRRKEMRENYSSVEAELTKTQRRRKMKWQKGRNQQTELNGTRPLAALLPPFFFFLLFFFCSPPAKAFCPATPVHFLAEKSHDTTRAHLVVSVDECETNHVNCIKNNTASEHGPGNLRSLGRKKRWRKTAESEPSQVLRLPQAAGVFAVSHRRTVRLGSSLGLMLAEWTMAAYTIAGRRRTSITARVCADDAIK